MEGEIRGDVGVEDEVEASFTVCEDPGGTAEELGDHVSCFLFADVVCCGETCSGLGRDKGDELGGGGAGVEVGEDFIVGLEGDEDGFGGGDAAGAGETVG